MHWVDAKCLGDDVMLERVAELANCLAVCQPL
jgi:hypothetical protein